MAKSTAEENDINALHNQAQELARLYNGSSIADSILLSVVTDCEGQLNAAYFKDVDKTLRSVPGMTPVRHVNDEAFIQRLRRH